MVKEGDALAESTRQQYAAAAADALDSALGLLRGEAEEVQVRAHFA